MYNPNPCDLESFSEQEVVAQSFTHMPTDYFRGTVMEPEVSSTLRPSFGEYEALGSKHTELSKQIGALNEAMKVSRMRGAFQTLQSQMKAVKELVKERERVDAQMATLDLARKKTDDHKINVQQETSYSEKIDSVSQRISLLESLMANYSEMNEAAYDFTRCVRPDGSSYGTRGKCKKGTESAAVPKESQIKEENHSWGRLIKASNDFKSNQAILHPEHQTQLHKLNPGEKTSFKDEQGIRWTGERKGSQIHLSSPREGKKPIVIEHSRLGSTLPKKSSLNPSEKVAKHTEDLKAAKAAFEATKAELKAHKGRDLRSRVKRQELQIAAAAQEEKMQKAFMKLLEAKRAQFKSDQKSTKAK